jgi:hypothetical protein
MHPPDRWEEIPPGANGQLDPEGRFIQQVGARALDAQRNPLRHRNQFRSTALHAGKNPGSNSGVLQEAEGDLITSQRLLVAACGGETVSLWFREQGGSIEPCESV